jgi:flagellar export protein FliJ
MKRFAFRLQKILDLRHAREKLKLADLGREQQRLLREQQKLTLFRDEEQSQMDDIRSDRGQPFSIWLQQANCRYLVRIGRVIEFQVGRVHEQTRSVETARGRYVEAHRDTQVLERLRDKRREEWTQETLHEEAVILDEIGSRRREEP